MPAKMRRNEKPESVCCSCKSSAKESLNMFDVKIDGVEMFTICDECMSQLFYKCLNAICYVNERTKTNRDLNIINRRKSKK